MQDFSGDVLVVGRICFCLLSWKTNFSSGGVLGIPGNVGGLCSAGFIVQFKG